MFSECCLPQDLEGEEVRDEDEKETKGVGAWWKIPRGNVSPGRDNNLLFMARAIGDDGYNTNQCQENEWTLY